MASSWKKNSEGSTACSPSKSRYSIKKTKGLFKENHSLGKKQDTMKLVLSLFMDNSTLSILHPCHMTLSTIKPKKRRDKRSRSSVRTSNG
jgi:hypothetical protein